MPAILAILIVLGAGLYVGSRFDRARQAHERFSSYRARTVSGLGSWLKNMMVAVLGAGALIFVLYLLLVHLHIG